MTQPSPTNLSEQLKEKIRNTMADALALSKYDITDEAIAAITAAYAEAINKIIGEDEPEEVTYFNSIRPVNINKWRNQLRAELRAAIQETEGK